MIIVPNERITRAAILTLKDAITNRVINTTLLKNHKSSPGFLVTDNSKNQMYAIKFGNEFKLNNLNGPAFIHHSGKEILFILNKSFTPKEYESNFYIRYLKQLELETPSQPIVGSGIYRLKNGGSVSLTFASKSQKVAISLYNKSYIFHTDSDSIPSEIDFIFRNRITWYKNGQLHRTSGPAVIQGFDKKTGQDGYVEFWINGEKHSKQSFDEYFKGIESQEDKDMLTDLGQSFD